MIRNAGSPRSTRLQSQGDGHCVAPEVKAEILFEFAEGKVVEMRLEQGGAVVVGNRVP